MGIDRALKRAVFFDRDGVLNDSDVVNGVPHPPRSEEELRIAEGARAAVQVVGNLGFLSIVVTNQPDVARGTQTKSAVEHINSKVLREVGADGVYTCFHDDADGCDCRKPKPGLLVRASAEWLIDLPRSYMIGDRSSDVLAGIAAGCTTILIDRDYSRRRGSVEADFTVTSLDAAIRRILDRE